MPQQPDIFSPENTIMRTWFAFKELGDKVQGTYVKRWNTRSRKYGNDQVVHDLLQPDGSIVSIGENVSHEFFNTEMTRIKFGQIVGIEFVGTKPSGKGSDIKIKKIYSNPAIIDEAWLKKYQELKAKGIDITTDGESPEEEDPSDEIPFGGGTISGGMIGGHTIPTLPQPAGTSTYTGPTQNALPIFPPGSVGYVPANPPVSVTPAPVEIPLSALAGQPFLTDEEKVAKIVTFAQKNLGATTPEQTKALVEAKSGLPFVQTNLDAILTKLYS